VGHGVALQRPRFPFLLLEKGATMTRSYLSRHVWRNAGAATVALVFSLAGQAALFYLMARVFGPANYGIVTLAFTILQVTTALASFGSETHGMRLIAARENLPAPVPNLLLTFQGMNAAAIVGVLLITVPFWAASERESAFISVIAICLIPDIITTVVGTSFYGRERFAPFGALIAGAACVMLAATGTAVLLGAPLLSIGATVLILKTLIATAAWIIHSRMEGPLRFATPGLAYRLLARHSAPYFLVAVLATVHMKVDIPLVRIMLGTAELGLYGLAAMVVNAAAAGILPLSASLFPAVAREGGAGARLHPARALRTLAIPVALGLGAAAVLFAFAGPLIDAWLGPKYTGSVQPLRILAWSLPVLFVSGMALRMMLACGKTRAVIRILAVNGAVNIVANLLLIPRAGIRGAALSTVLSTAVSAVQSVIFLARLTPSDGLSATLAEGRTR
jgi:O-antigen/teichoic acid export membrane protein